MNRVRPPSKLHLSYTELRTLLTCPHQFALRYDGARSRRNRRRAGSRLTSPRCCSWSTATAGRSTTATRRCSICTIRPRFGPISTRCAPRCARAARERVDQWAAAHLPLVRWSERAHLALVYRRLYTVLDDPALRVPSPLAVTGMPVDHAAVGDLPMLPPLTFSLIALDQPPFVVFRRAGDDRVYAASYRCADPSSPDELRYDLQLALFHEQIAATGVFPEEQMTVGYISVPLADTPVTPVFVQQDVLRQRQRLRGMLAQAERLLHAGHVPAVRGLHDGFPTPCLGCGVKDVCAP